VAPDPFLQEAIARGYDVDQWLTLTQTLYPGARPQSVLLVLNYCRARKLDPMKKPCHIVPKLVRDARSGVQEWRDVVLPGIYEYRATAMRTGLYRSHSVPVFGPTIEVGIKDHMVSAPEWCEMIFRRAMAPDSEMVLEFPVRIWFKEVVTMNRDGWPNERWSKAPIQMLTKCCEAAGLREAFPDEFGGVPMADEMDGQDAGVEAPQHQALDAPAARPQLSATRKSAKQMAAPAESAAEVVLDPVPTPLPVTPTEAAEPEPASATSPAAEGTAPAPEPKLIELPIAEALNRPPFGVIVDTHEHAKDGTVIAIIAVLSSGFRAAAKDAVHMQQVRDAALDQRAVALVTAPSPKNPTTRLPSILDVVATGATA
jgi:phage recombination protein Bet